MKAIVLCALVVAALADHAPAPGPYGPPPPAPAYGRPVYAEEKLPPQPFAYQYGVKDDYSGADFDKSETQDNYGNVEGSYRVNLPDGRVQLVSYHADSENGFVADVKYEGTPVYPTEPKYVPAPAPKYAPAPAPYVPAPAPYAPIPPPYAPAA